MLISEIEYLSSHFGRGIEMTHEKKRFQAQPFNRFLNACCNDAPDLFRMLPDKRFSLFTLYLAQ